MDDLKIKLDRKTIEKNLPLLIILISTILGLYIVSPVLKDGVLLNTDHPIHYSRADCLDKNEFLPPATWCAQFQAGMPINAYYSQVIDLAMVYLGRIVGLALAYKIIILLGLLIPAIGAYLLLSTFGRNLAGAFAYALILLNPGSWHIGGFEEVVLVGMWQQVITAGFLFIALALFIRFYREPSYKRMAYAALITPFMVHPYTLMAGVTAYVALVLVQWKESLKKFKWLVMFGVLTIMINGFHLIPILFNVGNIERANAWGGNIVWSDFMFTLVNKINWYVFIAAIIGLGFLIYSRAKKKETPLLTATSIFIITMVLSLLPGKIFAGKPFTGLRIEPFAAIAIFIFASIFFETIYYLKIKIDNKKIGLGILSLILFAITIYPMGAQSIQLSKSTILMPESQLSALYTPLTNLPPGRILVEETLYNAGQSVISFTHMHSLIVRFTGRELVGMPFYYPPNVYTDTDHGNLLGKQIKDYAPGEIEKALTQYNIRYVIAHTPAYLDYFNNHSKSKAQLGPFMLFETNITPAWFMAENGQIILEDYKKIHGKISVVMDKAGIIKMKSTFSPNWRASVDGKKAVIMNCQDILCIDVAQGNHQIEFTYSYDWKNYLGYALTLIGLSLSIYLVFFFVKKK